MFDSEFDSTGMSESDSTDISGGDDVEFLDTSDSQDVVDNTDEQCDADLADHEGYYTATRMTEEQLQEFDALWQSEKRNDIEPYKATRMTEEQLQEIGALGHAEKPRDIEPYKARRLTEEELKHFEEIWNGRDVKEPYRAKGRDIVDNISDSVDSSPVTDIGAPSLEEQFAAEVDALSIDDLNNEYERLASLGEMNDKDLFSEVDDAQKSNYDSESFKTLIDNLPRETLEYLRDGLASGNPDVYDYLGLHGDGGSDDTGEYKLTRKR